MELILLKCMHSLHSTNLRYLQAIGSAWKVLGGGRTHPWSKHASIFMGHHKPHLLAQLYAHRGLPIIIILIDPFYNSPLRSQVFDFEPSITSWKMEPISDAFKGIPFISVRLAE